MAPFSLVLLMCAVVSCAVACFEGAMFLQSVFVVSGSKARLSLGKDEKAALERLAMSTPARAILIKRKKERRNEEISDAMPEMLRLMGMSLGSGAGLEQSIEYAARNCEGALGDELKKTVWDLKAGQGFAEAMESLRRRCPKSEFSYLAAVMDIQHRSGGSMGEVLLSLSDSLSSAAKLAEDLKVQTAQGRLSSRIVVAIPLVLGVVLTMMSPGYFLAFFESELGVLVLALAIGLECVGVVLVRRLCQVGISLHAGG